MRVPATRNIAPTHVLEKLRATKSQVVHLDDVGALFSKAAPMARSMKRASETAPTIFRSLSHYFLLGNSLLEFLQKRKHIERKANALRQSYMTI